MRVFSLNTVALALLLLSLVAPTGAVLGDEIWEEEGIVLRPHDGPNGDYASYDEDGNLSVDLGDDLNPDAVTTVDDVFNISNEGSNQVRVWITHNATEYVEFRADGVGSIEGEENGTVLSPGETAEVGLVVDTGGTSPGTDLIDQMTVHARRESSSPPTESSSSDSSGSDDSSGSSAPTPTEREPTATAVGSGQVRVEFDRELRPGERVRIEPRDRLPPGPAGASVTAIASRKDDGGEAADGIPASEDRLRELGVDTAVAPGEPLVVSGTESLFPSASSIDDRRRTAVIYDISPPGRLRQAGATIWITLNRTRFGEADPADAWLARRTDDGWQLLETRSGPVNATHVRVWARTPGFSTFALFVESDVSFRWSFEGAGSMEGATVPVSYDEPGIYEGTLSVTDALGRTDVAPYRVLVNDPPRVRIERPETVEPGEPTTLRANVTDEFGGENVTVTWEFADGTVAEGTTVTRTFEEGSQVVTVTAVDEFGASGSSTVEFVVGGPDPLVQVVEFTLGFEGRLALVALLALAVIGVIRWLYDRRRRGVRRGSG